MQLKGFCRENMFLFTQLLTSVFTCCFEKKQEVFRRTMLQGLGGNSILNNTNDVMFVSISPSRF